MRGGGGKCTLSPHDCICLLLGLYSLPISVVVSTYTYTAEETIHEKLVEVKTEVAELEYSKQDPAQSRQHLRLSQSHVSMI